MYNHVGGETTLRIYEIGYDVTACHPPVDSGPRSSTHRHLHDESITDVDHFAYRNHNEAGCTALHEAIT